MVFSHLTNEATLEITDLGRMRRVMVSASRDSTAFEPRPSEPLRQRMVALKGDRRLKDYIDLQRPLAGVIERFLGAERRGRVLDVGCGSQLIRERKS